MKKSFLLLLLAGFLAMSATAQTGGKEASDNITAQAEKTKGNSDEMLQAEPDNCPFKGTPDCPLIKNCLKKGQPDCPYKTASAGVNSATVQTGKPGCCIKAKANCSTKK